MLKLPRKQDVWAMEFFLKLALTPNQIKFRNITNFPQTTVPKKVCPAAHSPTRWNEKLQARGFFRELRRIPAHPQRCECLQLWSRQYWRCYDFSVSCCGFPGCKPTRTPAPWQCAMKLTQVPPCVLCIGLDNELTETACFRQNVPYSVSRQHHTVSILSSGCWAGKLCPSAQVGRGQCDRQLWRWCRREKELQ